MEVIKTDIEGVVILKPRVFTDARGYFFESYSKREHVAVELTEENHLQFFVPRGFAHGFAVLSDVAVFQYKCDNFYHPESDGGISILDSSLSIDWRLDPLQAILSEKDLKHALLKDFDSPFDYNVDLYAE